MAARLKSHVGDKYALGQNADINVTPFVDILLVLLIIFMVAVPLATVAIKVDLPPAVAPQTPTKKPVFISIQKSGDLYIADKQTSLTTLASDLSGAFGVPNATDQTVMIRADKDVKYNTFMGVVNKLQETGFFKIGLISEDLSGA